jgi:hypothetical protein
MRHSIEHRQGLGRQMDELSLDHDQFRQNLTEQMEANRNHPLLKQIDEWEQKAIDQIHQNADEIRQQLLTILSKHQKNLSTTLTSITHELNQARENDDYFERDLNEWTQKINKLKEQLCGTEAIDIEQGDSSITLISKPLIIISSTEIVEKTFGNIRIEDNGQAIVHNSDAHSHAEARGKGEYSSGLYHFRFQIESFNANKWLFIGIISKDTTMREHSHGSLSSYGWASLNQVYLNGRNNIGYKGYKSDMEINDIMRLIIDCDRQKISLTNERTQTKWEMNVDLAKCPFPWQIHFNLHYADDRIRILST